MWCLDRTEVGLAVGGKWLRTMRQRLNSSSFSLQFWSTSILDAVIQVIGILFLRESKFRVAFSLTATEIVCIAYAPVLLSRKAAQIRKRLRTGSGSSQLVRTPYDGADRAYV